MKAVQTVFDVDLPISLIPSIERIALEKGLTLDSDQLEKLSGALKKELQESGVLHRMIDEAIESGIDQRWIEPDLKESDLVVGETYVIRDIPAIKREFRGKKVVYQGMSFDGQHLVRTEKGVALTIIGPGYLKKFE